MLVIVEGIDRVGKTTLVNMLKEKGFLDFKDEFIINRDRFGYDFGAYSFGKCETAVAFLKQLVEKGYNVVMDRLHLTEFVYGRVGGRVVEDSNIWELDKYISENIHAWIVNVDPTNVFEANERAGLDQRKHLNNFHFAMAETSINKISCNYGSLEAMVTIMCNKAFNYDFYFASPFFNTEQVEREERMIKHLRGLGYKVFSPKESCFLDPKAGLQSRKAVFDDNCSAIRSSMAVFAVTDGKDMGTIWEAGYAYGINKPVIYFAETLGNNQFNLMLAQSGRAVFTSQDDVTIDYLETALRCKTLFQYEGDIE